MIFTFEFNYMQVLVENICKFGNKMLKVGQSFERKNHTGGFGQKYGTVKCECVVPPLVKCTNVKNV